MLETVVTTADYSERIKAMSIEERRAKRRECLGRMLECIAYLAADVAELEPGSDELDDFYTLYGHNFTNRLVLVGNGQFLPELMHKFYMKATTLNHVSSMPKTVQQKIVDGETFDLVVVGPNGKQDKRQCLIEQLQPFEVRQLFARDHVRTEAEQVAWLDNKRRKASEPFPSHVGRVRIDKERSVAIFPRRGEYPLHELLEVVKILQK